MRLSDIDPNFRLSTNVPADLLARRLDAAQINLGFSGNAKGEPELAQYISKLDMSLFVYDYDYNAPTVEHLQETHELFFSSSGRHSRHCRW